MYENVLNIVFGSVYGSVFDNLVTLSRKSSDKHNLCCHLGR